MAPRLKRLAWIPAVLAGACLVWCLRRPPSAPKARLAVRAEGPGANGFALLVSDLMELQNRRVVLPATAMPPEGAPLLRMKLAREGDRIIVDATLEGRPLPRQEGPPDAALAGLARALSLAPPGPALIPADAPDAWELLSLTGLTQDDANAPTVARAEALVRREPGCASARLAWGGLLTRYLVEHKDADTLEAQAACEQNFHDGLADLPGYPRLVALSVIHLSDIGRQTEALRLLAETIRAHPGCPSLFNALAYAARTSGLLDTADRALERQSALTGLPRGQPNLADNTLLYTGRYRAFEASLALVPPGPVRGFYGGYARLLLNDREEALREFTGTQPGGLGSILFVRLAEVYRLALEGRTLEALAALDSLEAERTQIHLPDGEFTFKVAEAYGFLGEPSKALDVAERASVQGFGCAPWFERAPFLAGARKLPRWLSLDQHLRERRKLLADAFPPSAFGL